MIRLTKQKFEDPDTEYLAIPGNSLDVRTEELLPLGEKTFNLESYLEGVGFSKEKRHVLGCLANNECLPFADGSFDCYIANLSLMLVDNHRNMLLEAHRVTQVGSTLAFTVWGRYENVQNFAILDDVMIKHGLKSKEPPKKSSYDLGKDPEALRAEMETIGFTHIRIWYQPMNFNFRDAEAYCEAICQTNTIRVAL